jgi:8-oxo-dGTP pyrophosphatase MutT (NUDIX family)
MRREAVEEAGLVVADPILFAHEQIDPHDGVPADPKYPVPAFQVFFIARVVSIGEITATDECSESRRFAPDEARLAPGWVQRNRHLYEAGLELARHEFGVGA